VWSDVYSKKPEEYLEMVANGETPKWDSTLNKWISSVHSESTISDDEEIDDRSTILINICRIFPFQYWGGKIFLTKKTWRLKKLIFLQ